MSNVRARLALPGLVYTRRRQILGGYFCRGTGAWDFWGVNDRESHIFLVLVGVLFADHTARIHADSVLNQQDLATLKVPDDAGSGRNSAIIGQKILEHLQRATW